MKKKRLPTVQAKDRVDVIFDAFEAANKRERSLVMRLADQIRIQNAAWFLAGDDDRRSKPLWFSRSDVAIWRSLLREVDRTYHPTGKLLPKRTPSGSASSPKLKKERKSK